MEQTSGGWDSVFVSSDEAQQWAFWGELPEDDVARLKKSLSDGVLALPRHESAWIAVAKNAQGVIHAVSSAMLTSGFFWTTTSDATGRHRLLVGSSPAELVKRRSQKTFLDADFIRGSLLGNADPHGTPYSGVYRIQSGRIVTWASASDDPREVTAPQFEFTARPFLEGPDAMQAYLEAFDRTIDDAIAGTQPLAATLSGGLDSSFVVASLALKTTPDRPVHAFSHRPHPDAGLQPLAHWDPDDSDFAMLLEKQYPGRVVVTRVFNEELIQPLDAARVAAERSWWPTFNPANQIWLDDFQRRGAALGARTLFIGQKGNASFSSEPTYAAAYYLSRGRLDQVFALAGAGERDGLPFLRGMRSRVLAPLKAQLLRGRSEARISPELLRTGDRASVAANKPRVSGRDAFLTWLDPTTGSHMGAAHTDGQLLSMTDPFAAAAVIRVAAAMTPLQWATGQFPRGFARRAGRGRVPDEIRTRTRRGGQAWDTWFVMRQQKDRYFAEIDLLAQTPVLAELVNHLAVRALAESWDWDASASPSFPQLSQMTRLLALADFVRFTVRRLADLDAGS